jgi:DNA-binding transcriptional LysR family regulator
MDRLAAMEAFVRVVDAGSFSAAAKQLRVGRPAVSKAIAQLEERLGVRLLLRSTHGLTPTKAGRNFYEPTRRAVEESDEAELAARGAGETLSGRLRICGPLTFTRLHVMPPLSTFLTEHPALDIDVVLDDRDIDLIAMGIDVALLIGRLADSTVTARKIGQCQRHLIGAPAYFAARDLPHTPADLLAHQAIVYEQWWRRNLGLPTRIVGNHRHLGRPSSGQRWGGKFARGCSPALAWLSLPSGCSRRS